MSSDSKCVWWPVSLEDYSSQPIGLLYRGWRMDCTKWNLIGHIPEYLVCPYCGKQIEFIGRNSYYVYRGEK